MDEYIQDLARNRLKKTLKGARDALAEEDAAVLAAAWRQEWDDRHKRSFWWNAQTKESQWETPVGVMAPAGAVAAAPPPVPAFTPPKSLSTTQPEQYPVLAMSDQQNAEADAAQRQAVLDSAQAEEAVRKAEAAARQAEEDKIREEEADAARTAADAAVHAAAAAKKKEELEKEFRAVKRTVISAKSAGSLALAKKARELILAYKDKIEATGDLALDDECEKFEKEMNALIAQKEGGAASRQGGAAKMAAPAQRR